MKTNIELAEEFLKELTELTRKFGVGITGYGVLFLLETDDYNIEYTMDNDGSLLFE